MKTGVEKIIQAKGGDAPAKNQTGVQKIIELLGGDPPAKNQTGVDKIVEILEGGGGNPNMVQTINGTLANPFGDMTQAEWGAFQDAYYTGNASATLELDATVLGLDDPVYLVLNPWSNEAHFETCTIAEDGAACAEVSYLGAYPVTLNVARYYYEGTVMDFTAYASAIPTTLAIYWHPMPD